MVYKGSGVSADTNKLISQIGHYNHTPEEDQAFVNGLLKGKEVALEIQTLDEASKELYKGSEAYHQHTHIRKVNEFERKYNLSSDSFIKEDPQVYRNKLAHKLKS